MFGLGDVDAINYGCGFDDVSVIVDTVVVVVMVISALRNATGLVRVLVGRWLVCALQLQKLISTCFVALIIVVECLIDAGWPPHLHYSEGDEDVSAFAEGLRAAWLPTRSYCGDAGASLGGP